MLMLQLSHLGTKGRDILIWLLYAFLALSILTKSTILSTLTLLICTILIPFYLTLPLTKIRKDNLILMPIHVTLAKRLTRNRINLANSIPVPLKAYEIHVDFKPNQLIKHQWFDVAKKIEKLPPGLYLWESFIPIPKRLQGQFDALQKQGLAFVEKGTFLPRPPFIYLYRHKSKKPVSHGAFLKLN